MPAKAAGWRIEPPVSVPVAPGAMPRRDRRRRPARRAARRQRRHCCRLAPPRADHRAVGAGLVRRAHRELVHVELAEHPRARLAQVGGDGALVGRLEALEDVAARRSCRRPRVANRSLMPSGMPASDGQLAARRGLVRRVGRGERIVRGLDRIGVERPRRRDRRVEALGDLARGELARAETVAQLGDGLGGQLAHSITFGTAKKPCCASGALASTSSRTVAVGHDVVAQAKLVVDHRGQRLDAVGVDLAELLDPAEDIVEFGHQRARSPHRSSRCARAWRYGAPVRVSRTWMPTSGWLAARSGPRAFKRGLRRVDARRRR